MSWRRSGLDSEAYETFIVGEQLRLQMHDDGLVRDRRYHLRKYRQCFIGRDTVDWCVKLYHVTCRKEAVMAMNLLLKHGMIHHVTDEHEFRDAHLFYRFTRDDDSYKIHKVLRGFYDGVDLYRRLKSSPDSAMRQLYHKGTLYPEAFNGCDLLDFVCSSGIERDDALKDLKHLLERDIIKHVTDDYHFQDDRLIYEFSLDFNKPCILLDVLYSDRLMSSEVETSFGGEAWEDNASIVSYSDCLPSPEPAHNTPYTPPLHTKFNKGSASTPRVLNKSISSTSSETGSEVSTKDSQLISSNQTATRSISKALGRSTMIVQDDPNSPVLTRLITIRRDQQGFGFVLHGSSPCRVMRVDPLGPAAAAGLRVRQFVTHIDGQDVLQKDHRQVGLLVTSDCAFVTLTVIMDRNYAKRSDI